MGGGGGVEACFRDGWGCWAGLGGEGEELELGVAFLCAALSQPRGLWRRALGMDPLRGILCYPMAIAPLAWRPLVSSGAVNAGLNSAICFGPS